MSLNVQQRPAWNTGRLIGPKKTPLKPRHIWTIRTRLQHDHRVRDLARGGTVRLQTSIIQQKLGRPEPFELTDTTCEALTAWLRRGTYAANDWLFPSRSRTVDRVTTRQYGRLLG